MTDVLEIARRVLRIESEAVRALSEKLDRNFEKVIAAVSASKGRVVVTGMGKSGLVGKKIAATLASTGTPAFFMHAAEASHGDLGMVTENDVVMVISNSGETDEIKSLIPFLKRFNVTIISMTGNPASSLSRASDIHLDVSVQEEACPMGIVPTASTTAALAMGDAIAVALLTARGFREEDFASFHPKGNLGKRLFIKVSDVMHEGNAVPVITPDAPLTGAVIEISSKRLGMVVVVDPDRRVLGIITDGDVRRGLERWGKDFFDMRAGEVMIRAPKTISGDELAAKALSIMERHAITSLLVLEDDKVKGVVHLHDILRQGIA